MPQFAVKGTISGKGEGFVGRFHPQDFSVHLSGVFIPPLPLFDVAGATVEYNSLEDFTGTYSIVPPSFVGEIQLNLKLVKPGVELNITGKVDRPLPTEVPVTGTVKWLVD